ncbi:PEBP family protein [Vibrio sp. T187]|nr:PEBP family protein [Vibrio sp. T187]
MTSNARGALFTALYSLSTLSYADSLPGMVSINANVWADNWFAMYIGDDLVKQDSVSITTERSFNAESFSFDVTLPITLSFIIKDFKENDTGLEYIGSRKQQMGDGGFIAQFTEAESGKALLVSDNQWKCLPIHIAPLNKRCEKSRTPEKDCGSEIKPEPSQWKEQRFNDSVWANATVYSEHSVRPKGGYDRIDWHSNAKLIWTSDIETDNTILCRATLSK